LPGRENAAPSPYELPKDASMADIARQIQRLTKLSIRTHTPATIVTYDPARQVATLTVDHRQAVKVVDEVQLARVAAKGATVVGVPPNAVATLPPLRLVDIPVVFPRTQAGYVTFPLAAGDTGQLHVSDRSLAQWRALGVPSDPLLSETHSLADAVFYPGLSPAARPIVPPTDIAATVVEGPLVKLGVGATDFVALASLVIAALQQIHTAFNAHTHATPSGTSGPPVPVLPANPPPVGASKTQAV